MILWTLGHSTRSLEELVHVLEEHRIRHLVDIRTVPRSRTNPQFNRDVMPESLAPHRIAYTHLAGLGGLRKARPDSPNAAWENASFRGYADYMQTPEFEAALEELLAIAKKQRTAIMCAEAVPWRCHRSLVGDALVARGVDVRDLVGEREQPHRVTRFAKIDGARVTYPG